jgi:hypothetical protein
VRRRIRSVEFDDVIVAERAERLEALPAVTAAIHRVYAEELARVRGLEAKLQAHTNVSLALVPLIAAAVALGVDRSRVLSTVLALLAGAYVGLGFVAALTGLGARRLSVLSSADVADAIEDSYSEAQVASVELMAVESNIPVGIRLNNAIFAAQTSIVMGVILTSLGAVLAVM